MLIEHIFLGFCGLAAGLAVSAGTFAFLIWIPFGPALLCVYGISAGIFVGSIAVALAEILNTFPITFRRMGLKVGLFWVMLAMAAGKVAGSLYYFLGNFKAQ